MILSTFKCLKHPRLRKFFAGRFGHFFRNLFYKDYKKGIYSVINLIVGRNRTHLFNMALIEKIINPLSTFHHNRIFKYLCELDIEKIIDIGAHKGEFLENMIKIEKVNSFYAFEPQKNIFKELNEKFKKNEKVSLFNCAMDKEISKKKLKINKISMKSSLAEVNENSLYLKFINFLAQSQSSFEGEYEVKTNTVDKIFEDVNLQKALLKIDVEGFEMITKLIFKHTNCNFPTFHF